MLWRNWWFAARNRWFSGILGAFYAVFVFLMLDRLPLSGVAELVWHPPFLFVAMFLLIVCAVYADGNHWVKDGQFLSEPKSRHVRRGVLGAIHALAHMLALVMILILLDHLPADECTKTFESWLCATVFAIAMVSIGGVIAGTVFGIYLFSACWFLGTQDNEAFSNLAVADYKSFLRICIRDGDLFIYPIGLEQVPKHEQWERNQSAENDPDQPRYIPTVNLDHRLIEGPIRIAGAGKRLSETSNGGSAP